MLLMHHSVTRVMTTCRQAAGRVVARPSRPAACASQRTPMSLGFSIRAASAPAPAAIGGGNADSGGTATLHCQTSPESVTSMSSISCLHVV